MHTIAEEKLTGKPLTRFMAERDAVKSFSNSGVFQPRTSEHDLLQYTLLNRLEEQTAF